MRLTKSKDDALDVQAINSSNRSVPCQAGGFESMTIAQLANPSFGCPPDEAGPEFMPQDSFFTEMRMISSSIPRGVFDFTRIKKKTVRRRSTKQSSYSKRVLWRWV